ncbi:MAG: hypothetical protein JWO47_297 [Candidatus Saccharibacteria bacterium]|nr:hypothetical protein [Candidatus Saccharibacteria bacterium]
MSLGSAMKTVETALKFGKVWSREEFAGYGSKKASSAKSGAFANRVASLRSYGLISSTKDTIVATELAERLARPVDEAEQHTSLVTAFLNIEIFRKIYEESTHGIELPRSSIHSIAVTRYGIARDPRVIASFISSFIHSGVTAGLITAVGTDSIIFNNDDKALVVEREIAAEEDPANATVLDEKSVIKQPSGQEVVLPMSAPGLTLNGSDQNNVNVQGVEHTGKNWRLVVTFSSSLTIKSDMRTKIRALIASADEVADIFYDLEEKEGEM